MKLFVDYIFSSKSVKKTYHSLTEITEQDSLHIKGLHENGKKASLVNKEIEIQRGVGGIIKHLELLF